MWHQVNNIFFGEPISGLSRDSISIPIIATFTCGNQTFIQVPPVSCVMHKKFADTIPEAMTRRMTDNTTTDRKLTKWQTMVYTTLSEQLENEQHKPTIKTSSMLGLIILTPLEHSKRTSFYIENSCRRYQYK